MTIAEAIQFAKKKADSQNRPIEEHAVLLLLEDLNGFSDRTELFLHLGQPLQNEELFQTYLYELLSGKPLQYILKKAWFCQHVFMVDNRVMIPRMETEELVETVSRILTDLKNPIVFDVCTGSGCIAITLAKRFPQARLYAGDISPEALQVALINQKRLETPGISFLESNLLCSFPSTIKADLIVANPPYIDASVELPANVKDHEPRLALIPPSGNGLEFYQRLFASLSVHLKEGGYFCAEMGENQKEAIQEMAARMLPNSTITFYRDLSNKDRYFVLQYQRIN